MSSSQANHLADSPRVVGDRLVEVAAQVGPVLLDELIHSDAVGMPAEIGYDDDLFEAHFLVELYPIFGKDLFIHLLCDLNHYW